MDYERIEKAAQRRNRILKTVTYTLLTLWETLRRTRCTPRDSAQCSVVT